ncbi:MAG TPA: SRPBCC domain-containing protein, partial [Candidatus Thermoplasmatota archaeon]|nr:SRPBCC domain-containing protein [Candidatus Thermoplasmatota archaeon]
TMTNAGQTVRNHGVYKEVVPNRRLAQVWDFDIFLAPGEKPYEVPVSVDLAPAGSGTKMTFKQGPLATAEFTEGSRQGVTSNFDRLAKTLGG